MMILSNDGQIFSQPPLRGEGEMTDKVLPSVFTIDQWYADTDI
jgi:hypothetical protein